MTKPSTTKKKQELKTSKRTAKKPTVERKGGRLTKAMWKYVLKDAEILVDEGKWGEMSDLALSKRWNVSRETAKRIRGVVEDECMDEVPFIKQKFMKHFSNLEEDLAEMHQDMRSLKSCYDCQETFTQDVKKCPFCGSSRINKNYKEKLTLVREIPNFIKECTNFLEQWGDKQKVADKVDVSANTVPQKVEIIYTVPNGNPKLTN